MSVLVYHSPSIAAKHPKRSLTFRDAAHPGRTYSGNIFVDEQGRIYSGQKYLGTKLPGDVSEMVTKISRGRVGQTGTIMLRDENLPQMIDVRVEGSEVTDCVRGLINRPETPDTRTKGGTTLRVFTGGLHN